ncbi:MAG: mannose-6-phosphate isomerase, class I [Demequinaceae bacterium]|nr:mannose-6-phosphate isomerase, class I [Demequinaceae bacterium]
MIALTPALQRFDWGSSQGIPDLLGFAPDGGPYAEAWWGAHPSAPSGTERGPLDEVIAADPIGMLGEDVARAHGRLPFLLKVLSIARPLSIQVHPTLAQASAGFAAEENLGVAIADPNRTYRDASHKPEMLLAVTEMTVLSGFRRESDLMSDLERLGSSAAALRRALAADGIAGYVTEALTADCSGALLQLAEGHAGNGAEARIACDALTHFESDAGALVALAMNAVTLEPGEALYTPAGTVHCYISGDGVEIMANSDNVVRAGLTHKPINASLLRDLAVLAPVEPVVPSETAIGAARRLSTDATEFELVVVSDGSYDAGSGPRIVLAIDAEARVHTERVASILGRGESVFVADSEGPIHIETKGVVVVASVPGPRR